MRRLWSVQFARTVSKKLNSNKKATLPGTGRGDAGAQFNPIGVAQSPVRSDSSECAVLVLAEPERCQPLFSGFYRQPGMQRAWIRMAVCIQVVEYDG